MRQLQFPSLVVALILTATTILSIAHGPDLLGDTGSPVDSLIATADSATLLYEHAVERFRDQRYKDAVTLLDAAASQENDIEPRALAFYRAAAALRLAVVNQELPRIQQRYLDVLRLAGTRIDTWGARAVRELVRAHHGSRDDLARLLPATLEFWEESPDIELATAEYFDLLMVLLDSARDGWIVEMPLQRMWDNLRAADVPRHQLLDTAALLLAGRVHSAHSPYWRGDGRRHGSRYMRWMNQTDSCLLIDDVAAWVLAGERPDWLASVAHLELGNCASRARTLRDAERHYRAAITVGDSSAGASVNSARRALTELVKPVLRLQGDSLYRPGSQHQLRVHWRNLSGWWLELRRIDPKEDLRPPDNKHHRRFTLVDCIESDAGAHVLARKFRDADEIAARRQEETAGEQRGEPHLNRQDIVWLDPLPPGIYLATVRGETLDEHDPPEPAQFLFHVTDLGLVYQSIGPRKDKHGWIEFWLVDMESGEPIAEAKLTLYRERRDKRRRRWMAHQLTTDANGLTRFQLPQHCPLLIFGEHGGCPIVAHDFHPYRSGNASFESWRSFTLTDRPLYRPGETVHIQAFLRETDAEARRDRVPQWSTVELEVHDPEGNLFDTRKLELNDNGACETSLELPQLAALGSYQLRLRLEKEERARPVGHFQVGEYRLPEFRVEVGIDEDRRHVLGDTLAVELNATYLFGGPVAGNAEIVVRQAAWQPSHRPRYRCGWLWGNTYVRSPRWAGKEIMRIERSLDASGKLTVRIPTDPGQNRQHHLAYTIEARVTDVSRREETGQATVRVGRQEFFAFLDPDRHLVAPGDEVRLELRVQDAMDGPVEVAGQWSVSLSGKHAGNGDDEEQLFSRQSRTTTDGTAGLRFTPDRPGHYAIRFETRDGRGNEVVATTRIWCADPRTRMVTHSGGSLQLITERDEFLDGDVARVLLVSDVPGVPVYLHHHLAGTIESEIIRLDGSVHLLEIPLDQQRRPYSYLQAARAGDYRLHQARVRIVAPDAAHLLDVRLDFDRQTYAPGAAAALRVHVSDALGRPVSAPVTIAVVDQAILALLPRQLREPESILNRYDIPVPRDLLLNGRHLGGYLFRERPPEVPPGKVHGAAGNQQLLGYGVHNVEAIDVLRASTVSLSTGAVSSWGELHFRGGRGGEVQIYAPFVMRDVSSTLTEGSQMFLGGFEAEYGNATSGIFAPTSMRHRALGEAGDADRPIRADFRTTAYWRTGVLTGTDGTATVEIPLPESLTGWEALGVAITPENSAGLGTGNTRTRKDVMVRLNHPRVLRQQDRFLLAATVHNETDADLEAAVKLTAPELQVEGGIDTVIVVAHGQAQVEWWASIRPDAVAVHCARDERSRRLIVQPAETLVQVSARTAAGGDAFVRRVKLLPHGTPLQLTATREIRPGETTLELRLPAARTHALETAVLTLSPSVLSACIDALGYLADYPYGCTEQTLSRFVPALAVRHAAQSVGLESRRFDPDLDQKIATGLARIESFQQDDGGWGWWKEGKSHPYMTAHVMVALARAAGSGVEVEPRMLRAGRKALRDLLPRLERRDDDMAYALFALAAADRVLEDSSLIEDETMRRYAGGLFDKRDGLRDYSRALLAVYLARGGHAERARLVLMHLDNTVTADPEYGTVHWGARRHYWRRSEGAVETTAFALQAYGEIAPDHPHLAGAARWLVMNRKASRWDNTRATAHAIYALVDYATRSGELAADYTLLATLGNEEITRLQVNPGSIIDAGGQFRIPNELLLNDEIQLQLRLEGQGVCYATLSVETFTEAENPAPTKHYLAVRRELFRLHQVRTLGGDLLTVEERMADGGKIASGERFRVRLHLTAVQDLEFLAIEDPRLAGAEPLHQLSGWYRNGALSGRREVRDDKVVFFVSSLREGEHQLEYELRAESPGTYHLMPARGYAMYVPEIHGSSAEHHAVIED